MRLELDEKDVQVAARKGPFEWSGGALIASLEGRQTAFEGREVGEVARREKLTLNNGEIDLDLVEPAGVDRRVAVSYTHLRAHETVLDLVCRLLLEKKKQE